MSTDGVPVGRIVSLPTNTFPSKGWEKRYLLCDGSTFSTSQYQKLAKVLHGNKLPDMRNRTLWGANGLQSSWKEKRAGLPNIKGKITASNNPADAFLSDYAFASGAFTLSSQGGKYGIPDDTIPTLKVEELWGAHALTASWGYSYFGIDTSRSNNIYGKSSTVQPPAITMNFYIKAK